MKRISSPPVSVPRLNSLLHRLQKNPGPEDEPYLDQLMMFLDNPPAGVTDRWKAGAEMCAAWGVTTTGTSVWRLFRSYLVEWRVRIALKIDGPDPVSTGDLHEKISHLIALRRCELLLNPATPAEALVGLIRADLDEKYLQIARRKQIDAELDETMRALDALEIRAGRNREAQIALLRLKEAVRCPGPARGLGNDEDA